MHPTPVPPVFSDQRHRRGPLVRFLALGVLFGVIGWLFAFWLSLVEPDHGHAAVPPGAPEGAVAEDGSVLTRLLGTLAPEAECARPAGTADGARPEIHAFLPDWPDWGLAALQRECALIDVAMPEWFAYGDPGGAITPLNPANDSKKALRAFLSHNRAYLKVFAVARRSGDLSPEATAIALDLPAAQARFLADVAALAQSADIDGLCFDIRGFDAVSLDGFSALLGRADAELARAGRDSCVIADFSVPPGSLGRLAGIIDKLVVLGFDSPADPDVPPAPQPWFESRLAALATEVGGGRLVIGLGTESLAWTEGGEAGESIGYGEAMRRAAAGRGEIGLTPGALNTWVRTTDPEGRPVRISVLDAVSLNNQLAALRETPVAGVAIWPVGFEDPGVWDLLRGPDLPPADAAARLATVTLDTYVEHEGAGAFRAVLADAVPGLRRLETGGAGRIVGQTYDRIPTPLVIRRWGRTGEKLVALTFDDGPDARYTGQVLDILRDRGVKAAFFVLGRMAQRSPDSLRRIVADGHELGSHSFFHPYLHKASPARLTLELNALQRLIVSATGHATRLFRIPYSAGDNPTSAEAAVPLRQIDDAGYVTVAVEIVPPDWTGIGPEEVVDFIRTALAGGQGNVILLHDGGGDRSATVAALPLIIDRLRADGYEFVSLARLMGSTREALMPVDDSTRVWFDSLSFSAFAASGTVVRWIFWIAIYVGIVRSLFYLFLAHVRRPDPPGVPQYLPPVTVVVPAFNEEKVILDCVAAILASDYPDLRVIVMDDGSQDHTRDLVRERFGGEARVRILHEANQGKWMAMDTAYGQIATEIVVAVDADTVVRPDAIRQLVQPLRDPRVGAVAGVVKVANRVNLLTWFQTMEYVTTQSVIRRAADFYGGQLVVPGALGAWRVAAVRAAGFYSPDTLVEDADLTIAVHRAGYKVRFAEKAVARTEVPARLLPFMRQRLRWVLGMLQAGWKHRGAIAEGRTVGLISIGDFLVIGTLNQLLAPIVDLALLVALADICLDAVQSRPILPDGASLGVVLGYLVLPVLDLMIAIAALRFDREEPRRLLLLVPLWRLYYRQLLYITVYRAVWRALTGRLATWGRPGRRPSRPGTPGSARGPAPPAGPEPVAAGARSAAAQARR